MSDVVKEPLEKSKDKIEITADVLQILLQKQRQDHNTEDEIDLSELWCNLMKRKWLIVTLTSLVTFVAVLISFSTTPLYQSTVTLMPVSSGDSNSGMMSKYGGLASLAGISLPSGGDISQASEAVSILKSKRFLAEYILEKDLKKQIFYQHWDSQTESWRTEQGVLQGLNKTLNSMLGVNVTSKERYEGQEQLSLGEPSVYKVVEYFVNNILSISEDTKSGLFTLKIKWENPVIAKGWANELVLRVDNELRQKAIEEAEQNIQYMNDKLPTIELQDLRMIALKMIEESIKKVTFAQVKNEYVFKVIDPAIVAENAVSPKKGLMIAVGFVLGLMLSIFIALILAWRKNLIK